MTDNWDSESAFPEGTASIYCGGGYYFFCDKDGFPLKAAEKRENSCIIKVIRLCAIGKGAPLYLGVCHKIQKCKCEPINNLSPKKGQMKWRNLFVVIIWWAFHRVLNTKRSLES
jgi:hypothetical protein